MAVVRSRRNRSKSGETWVGAVDPRGEQVVRCRFCEASVPAKDWWLHSCRKPEEKKE